MDKLIFLSFFLNLFICTKYKNLFCIYYVFWHKRTSNYFYFFAKFKNNFYFFVKLSLKNNNIFYQKITVNIAPKYLYRKIARYKVLKCYI